MSFDTVIRNGTVVDGSGLAPFRADVGISDGRIARIGRVNERGTTDIDAEGHVVTPGFIDAHTHMDAQVFWDELGTNSCWHGVTTVVMGHCGFTLAPTRDDEHELVVRNLERAEDIAPAALAAGIDWSWTTSPATSTLGPAPERHQLRRNIGHSALRTYVMGERAFEEQATADDLVAMRDELGRALAGRRVRVHLITHRAPPDLRRQARRVAARLMGRGLRARRRSRELGAGVFQMATTERCPTAIPTECSPTSRSRPGSRSRPPAWTTPRSHFLTTRSRRVLGCGV